MQFTLAEAYSELPIALVVLLELAAKEKTTLVEQCQRDDGLHDTNALTPEDAAQSCETSQKLRRVLEDRATTNQ